MVAMEAAKEKFAQYEQTECLPESDHVQAKEGRH
jgi:hypothetical protein